MSAALTFGSGALLGFASSLHCVSMCGGIAMLFGLPGGAGRGPRALLDQLPLHGGRALSYMMMGGLAGGLGGAALGAVQIEGAHAVLRWAAAATLGWIGLSMLGLMPSPAVLGHALAPRFAMPQGVGRAPVGLGRLAAGIGWGFLPCGMVYGALLYAAFTGSAFGGMAVMGGFALGTVPALLAVQSGSSVLSRLARRPQLRAVAGGALLLFAVISVFVGETSLLAACRGLLN